MGASARSRSKKTGRSTRAKNRSASKGASLRARTVSAFRGILTTIVLVGAGILIGSFWGEWQVVRLGEEPAQDPPPPLSERIKVEVLNGSGEAGLAQRVSDELRDLGFDVVAVGNADHFDHPTTHVLDRSGRLGAAGEVATGLDTDSVAVELEPDLFLDATVIVGRDRNAVASDN